MQPPPGDRLRGLRAELATRLASGLAAGNVALPELRDLQERLKMLDAVLAEQRLRQQRRLGAALWPVLLVAILLLLAATVPWPSVPLSLELRASTVTLGFAERFTLGPQSIVGELRIEGFNALASGDAGLTRAAAQGTDSIAIDARDLRLRGLHLPAGARLTVQARGDVIALQIESPSSPVMADLELHGSTTLRLGAAAAPMAFDFAHGEWLRLTAGDAAHPDRAAPPMSFSMPDQGDALRFEGLRPSELRFAEQREGGQALAVVGSSIDGGTLALPATGQTLQLAGGDWLEIDGLAVERCELGAGAPLLLKLGGSARGLGIKVGGFERSLKPSVLEYVSRHHLVQLLWASAAVLWAALAWLRRSFGAAVA